MRVGGQDRDLPAKLIKRGSFEDIDLSLLAVEEAELPVSLLLRRNPLCEGSAKLGMEVVNVTPEGNQSNSLDIATVNCTKPSKQAGHSDKDARKIWLGIFDAERKCLLGIVSAKVKKYKFQTAKGTVAYLEDAFAGYFVPTSKISDFMPPDLHF